MKIAGWERNEKKIVVILGALVKEVKTFFFVVGMCRNVLPYDFQFSLFNPLTSTG